MGKYRKVVWYIYTTDSHTNKVISEDPSEKSMHNSSMCSDGIPRPLWECTGQFVTKMRQSKEDLHLVFQIFKKDNEYGKIKKATFLKPKPKPKFKKL